MNKMEVKILAGGSSGNCIAVNYGKKVILVDAGIAKTKIEKRLLDEGIHPNDIASIFITHAHSDHVKGLPFANKYKIPVFATKGEWELIKCVDEELKNELKPYEILQYKDLGIINFKTHHDSREPLGYAMELIKTGQKVSICLDTGTTDEQMLKCMKNSDIYVIEANHEPRMVEVSSYPNSVKARILSDIGHLSNQQTANVLYELVQGKKEKVYVTHLSKSNNFPQLAKLTVENKLKEKGLINGIDYFLEVV